MEPPQKKKDWLGHDDDHPWLSTLVYVLIILALLGPIVVGVIYAIKGYFVAWEKGEWLSIGILVFAVVFLVWLEPPRKK